MGVPSFIWWLVSKYPKIVVNAWVEKRGEDGVVDTTQQNPNGIEFDNLYLDMNAVIYPCFHGSYRISNRLSRPSTFDEVFSTIFEYIDWLFRIVRPRKLLYMAIDGVASTAKMDKIRCRRFLTAKGAELRDARREKLRREFEIKENVVLPKISSEVSDPTVITPGTEFMDRLSKALKCYICSRLKTDPGWKDIKVILSDANVPGEGKHKIMSFIRLQRNRDGYNPNTRHCVYGGDADLIMLALATHEVHFSILREDAAAREQQASRISSPETSRPKQNVYSVRSREWFIKFHQANDGSSLATSDSASLAKTPFQFLNIWTLREYLELDMTIAELPKDFLINFERIVDDFVFLCFFLGNDFLPELPLLGTHEGAMDLLMAVYKKEFKSMGGYLTDTCRLQDENAAYIKFERVEQLILAVGSYEDKIFKKRSEIRKRRLDRILREILEDRGEEDFDNVEEDSKFQLNSHSLDFNGLSSIRCSVTDYYEDTEEFIQKLKDLLQQKSDLLKNNLLTDKVNLGSEGWKAQYYKEKFSVEKPDEIETKRKEIVQKYVEGLCWVLRCYFEGVCSWSWYYNHHFGPFASDFKGLGGSWIDFQLGTPFKPLAQLMAVLPPRSAHALPEAYRTLMTCSESNIIDFYPTDFEVDTDGECVLSLLQFIDEKRLLLEIEKLENKLKDEEVRRNVVAHEMIFVRASHDLGLQVSSLCSRCSCASGNEQIINKMTIDSEKSNGLNGFLMRCDEQSCLDDGSSLVKGMEYTMENDVVCAMFENPLFDYHIPEPPKNVTMPEKTITEADIKQRVLWHEYNGRQSKENRLQNCQRYAMETGNVGNPTSSDPSSEREMWKGVGSGRGGGRGKGSLENSNCSWSSETCRGIQVRNSGFGELRNAMWAHRSGSWQYNTPPDNDLHGQGRGRGNRSFEETRSGQTSVAVRGVYDRNGSFNASGNGSRADRSDNWRSTSQLPAAPTYQGRGRGCFEPSSSNRRW
ncbi:5'-3' exoribonuclease 3-like isoform X2 [Magnolia sinica]|uniref:5'-3' exoribonuclease 3-like isoform X2 n=1 Tax=Magnolia sinica TaxID=86752 RepID=UPI00265B2EDC|nr:5'-3' exoribonuclease 3-like isoform X2 [Magnolia sinica]